MKENNTIKKIFKLFLLLVAIHSFFVGLGLIFLPKDLMLLFGFQEITNNFFPVQGGVFHIIMAVIYIYAIKIEKLQFFLIPLIIGVKLFAAFFLFVYYFAFEHIITVLLSGIGDGMMGIILYYFYIKLKKNNLILIN